MPDATSQSNALLSEARANKAEEDALVAFLRQRCAALHTALLRVSDELAQAREALAEKAQSDAGEDAADAAPSARD